MAVHRRLVRSATPPAGRRPSRVTTYCGRSAGDEAVRTSAMTTVSPLRRLSSNTLTNWPSSDFLMADGMSWDP